jgi:hypothetical protein
MNQANGKQAEESQGRRLVPDLYALIQELKDRMFYGTVELKFINGHVLYANQTESIRFAKPETQPTRTVVRDRSHDGQNPKAGN